jgi:hypothetical protein
MTILDKAKMGDNAPINESKQAKPTEEKTTKPDPEIVTDNAQILSAVESQFKNIMQEFQASKGFSVDTGEQPVDTMVELLSSAGVNVSIVLLLSYIRYCINHGLKKDITLKIGYNKPAAIPMNFAVNEELLEEIFPGDVVEIN